MTERYPPPSYAASIWLVGDTIMLAMPEASTVQIPLSRPNAISALLAMLKARAISHRPKIGEAGAQVRNDVEKALESDEKFKAWLSAMNEDKAAKAAAKAEAERVLSEIGL
jgi:hypothetical protein